MIIGIVLGVIITLAGGGFGGYYLGKSAGISEATGGSPDASYQGKWFMANCYTYEWNEETSCSYEALWLKEDGSIGLWGPPYFKCSDGMHIRGYYVNDGDNDCVDGTDEGTVKANNFNSDTTWINVNGLKMAEYNAQSYNDYYYRDYKWGINDADQLCFSFLTYKDTDNVEINMLSCQQVWLSNDAMWSKYEIFDDDLDRVGSDDTDCAVMVRINRASGPPDEDNQAWSDLMELEISEAMTTKPGACSGTTYQELTQGFSDNDY